WNGPRAGGRSHVEAIEERHPEVDAGQLRTVRGRQEPPDFRRVLAQLARAFLDAREIGDRRFVDDVDEESAKPTPLAEVVDPSSPPRFSLRPCVADGLALSYGRSVRVDVLYCNVE